ncbi:hypothetical protein BDE02_01G000200 [Populus trichocarpa]|nr:hypothetical protein BDE02_01G000200 [Populus trichocarpa]
MENIMKGCFSQEEPGGQRALIFDQGNRISQGISCAYVADICVKALHDSTARNKSFDGGSSMNLWRIYLTKQTTI